jgi:hypothetical protein
MFCSRTVSLTVNVTISVFVLGECGNKKMQVPRGMHS